MAFFSTITAEPLAGVTTAPVETAGGAPARAGERSAAARLLSLDHRKRIFIKV